MKILKSLSITLLSFFILLLLTNTLSYFYIINANITSIFLLLTTIISVAIGSFILGKNTTKKGYIEGIKYGLIINISLFILNIIFYKNITISTIIKYIIIILISTISSMLGISKNLTK